MSDSADQFVDYPIYRLKVKYKVPLLSALVEAFCGDAHLSLEGDLAELRWDGPTQPEPAIASVLRRNTVEPVQDFVVLPLERDSIDRIVHRVLPHVGLKRRVHHVQIEKERRLVFGAYDWFDEGCAWVSQRVGTQLLDALVREGVLKSYAPPPEA
jgi:hypothetical protein